MPHCGRGSVRFCRDLLKGYGVHPELGEHFEVTIESTFRVVDGDTRWGGEPLTADAAGRRA